MWAILGIIVAIVVVLFVVYTKTYNKLVQLRNGVKNAWANIDVELKRRFDLIPNLVETAKAVMNHESETMIAVIEARNGLSRARKSGDIGKQIKAENAMSGALAGFRVTMEAYPDLKANQQMGQLMGELTSTENQIAGKRQGYNNSVNSYNNSCEMFPSNIIAGMFNFERADFFEIEDEQQREAVKVSFSDPPSVGLGGGGALPPGQAAPKLPEGSTSGVEN